MVDEDVGDYIYQRRSEEPPATWKVIASGLGMTISQLDYWRRKHGWVDEHPINKRRFSKEEIRDDEVENALNRGLSANLPLTTILQLMPVEMDRHRLWRWRRDHDYVDPRERVRGSDLDSIVRDAVECRPNTGEVMIRSYLAAAGVSTTRVDLRESMQRVDPEGRKYLKIHEMLPSHCLMTVEQRRKGRIHRRVYNVQGPHHLWHLDGNHKLRDFHLVIHGCIDGFSRNVIYLKVSDNNCASTVYDFFVQGTQDYCIPSRIRTDKGGENVRVADWMISNRGMGRNSVIAGRSVHNQRIERLWRDVRVNVVDFYRTIFYEFAHQFGVDFSNETVVYCIHYLFMGMIQEDLNDFCKAWNKHGLRTTAGNRTPEQLLLMYEHLEPETPEHVDDDYGREEEDGSVEDVEQVVVLPLLSPLSEEETVQFMNSITPASKGGIQHIRTEFFADVEAQQSFVLSMYGLYLEASRCLRALRQR